MKVSAILYISFILILTVQGHLEYYWRDYTGTIPSDAICAGYDTSGMDSYIGQAYMHGVGTVVVQIFPGQKDVYGSAYGYKKAPNVVKILCSKKKDRFIWFRTNAQKFHSDMIGKHPVIGGYDHADLNKWMLHIGRVVHQVDLRVGSIEGFIENAWMNYVHETTTQRADKYDVLIYEDNEYDFDIDVRTSQFVSS